MSTDVLEIQQPSAELTAVLCGSFRRDPDGLRKTFERLRCSYSLLSPVDVAWVDPDAEFVKLAHEDQMSLEEVEGRHLSAILDADFVWLFCPGGYVGTSASMEIGYAHAHGVPVLSDVTPSDGTIASMVTIVHGGLELVSEQLAPSPGRGIGGLQRYYGRTAARRGWDGESPRDTLLLLTEEFGELARAIRKQDGLRRDGSYPMTDVGLELADVQLYVVHLANALGIDLADAVTAKEQINANRQNFRAA